MTDGLTQHVPHVYRLSLRLTSDPHRAEDLTQETFLRAWQSRQTLKSEKATRVWLFRITVNLWNDELRRKNRTHTSSTLQTDEADCSAATPDQHIEQKDDLVQALQLLDELPPQQRTVLYLAAVEELSLDEICKVLEIDKNTAKVNLSLARKRMREELAKRMPNVP